MAQPEFVPLADGDRVRVNERLPTPDAWYADRVGEVRQQGAQPRGPLLGTAGPDQGYALKLAAGYRDRLVLGAHEHLDDAVGGCLGVALRRAALFGRAPVIHDLELAFALWGFLEGAPPELVAFRKPLFDGAAHHYNDQRTIADQVPEATLRLTPTVVKDRLSGDWRSLLGLEGAAAA